jgi:predicted  nucleic acid-binding Zn-ribbon protein
MQPAKQLWEWHRMQDTLSRERTEQAEIGEQLGRLEQSAAHCEQQVSALDKPVTTDDEIERMLAEQELWLARNALQQFLQEKEERLFSLAQSVQQLEFSLLAAAQNIPEEWISEYYRLAKTKSNPIVEVRNDACTGCFMALSLRNKNEWRSGKGLVHCDECGRILV